jgi:hypothetical protein
MSIHLRRRVLGVLTSSLTLLVVLLAVPSWAADKARLRVDDYRIEAELTPHLHTITARAKVKFTALQDLSVAIFELHNDLRVTKVLDEKNQPLSAERVTQDSTIRVPLPAGLAKDASTTLTFEYEGQLESADNSPVPGLKLAYIGDDTSYLLYAGRWFPVSGFGLNRFTSTISVTIPAHMLAIGSGKASVSDTPASKKPNASVLPTKTFTFVSDKPSFPGTIIAGVFQEYKSDEAGLDLHVFFKPTPGSDLHYDCRAGVHVLHHALRFAAVPEVERGRNARRHRSLCLGARDRRNGGPFDHREDELSSVGRRDRTPVVGSFGEPGDEG